MFDLDAIRPAGIVGVGAAGDAAGYNGEYWFIRRDGRMVSYDTFERFIAEIIREEERTGH